MRDLQSRIERWKKDPEIKKMLLETPEGFFGGLSEEQKKSALSYRGEESHGDTAFLRGARDLTPAQK